MTLARKFESSALGADISPALSSVIVALIGAAQELQQKLAHSATGHFSSTDIFNASGDQQTQQDRVAHELFVAALDATGAVGHIVSEEANEPVELGTGDLSVGIDPFDGSSAYQLGVPPGTIFAIFEKAKKLEDFCGKQVVASGLFVYSQRLELFLAINGSVFEIDANRARKIESIETSHRFVCANLSNIGSWPRGWARFFSQKVLETDGDQHFNMRWFGSLATHAKATILTGGLFAYPPDEREGYESGHLRLIYEAIPISFIIETLGGAGTDGLRRIAEIVPESAHQKVPLVFGEKSLVKGLAEAILRYP